jgi:hypothetical protein
MRAPVAQQKLFKKKINSNKSDKKKLIIWINKQDKKIFQELKQVFIEKLIGIKI